LNVVNNSNFDVKVDSVSYDASLMQLDTSACNGVITAHGKCAMPVKSKEAKADAEITFNEFGGGVIKATTLHINDGVSVIAQPKGNSYYATLPNDGNFYQVFSVVNNTDKPQGFSLTTQHNEIAKFMRSNGVDIPLNAFIEPNCLDADSKASVAPQSQCEIIIREPSDLNIVQPFEQSILQVEVDYSYTQDIFVHRYQAQVLKHNEHRDAVSHPGETINPNYPIDPNNCGFPTNGTIIWSSNIPGTGQRYTMGAFLSVGDDNTTIKVDTFIDIYKYCHKNTAYLNVQNNQIIVSDQSGSIIAQQSVPIKSDINFNGDSNTVATLLPSSICDGTNCSINLKVLAFDPILKAQISNVISFLQPSPARDWTVVDAVVWNDIGTISKKK
jgi:hypothetical protein